MNCATPGRSAHKKSSNPSKSQREYYFRFGGNSHHAGEYQNYIEYFARCLESGETPKPDVREGIVTVALMQAMDESTVTGQPVRVRDVLARYGIDGRLDEFAHLSQRRACVSIPDTSAQSHSNTRNQPMNHTDFLPFRQIHLDFHTSELIPDVGIDFDPDEFADTLVRAHVNSITCFARCHHGWIYYDTALNPERRHPHLNRDLLREQIEACHARGIRAADLHDDSVGSLHGAANTRNGCALTKPDRSWARRRSRRVSTAS